MSRRGGFVVGVPMLLVLGACGSDGAQAPASAGGDAGWCARYDDYLAAWGSIYDDLGLDETLQEDSQVAAAELLPLWSELLTDAPSDLVDDVETVRVILADEADPSIDWTEIPWGDYDRAMDRLDEFCG